MTTLNQSHGFLLTENLRKEIIFLHNPTNFGGTLLRPTDKVGCLVGIGPKAIPVIVKHQGALLSIQKVVPSITNIDTCTTINELNALPTPSEIGGIVNLEGLQTYFPAPFLQNTILTEDTFPPLFLSSRAGMLARSTFAFTAVMKILRMGMSTTTLRFYYTVVYGRPPRISQQNLFLRRT
jgi:hypothetical protein